MKHAKEGRGRVERKNRVAESTFVIGGVRSIQSGGPGWQRDGWTRHNTSYRYLIQLWRKNIISDIK
ncbi:hypothetical protein INR49_027388 [Caranx melampygus]|nr:hypothetical protein INR49_027388 [Caranx melampygus]